MTSLRQRARRLGPARSALVAAGLTLVLGAVLPAVTHADTQSLAGSAGVNPTPPDTSSVVSQTNPASSTPGLKVTITQSTGLVNQTIGVRWSGAAPTTSINHPPGQIFQSEFDNNWLAIFQCWGDPSPSDPLTAVDPGPSPQQCEAGGASINGARAYPQGSSPTSPVPAATRIIAHQGDPNYAADQAQGGVPDPYGFGELFQPFKAVDGTVVGVSQNDTALSNPNVAFWLNPYFSFNTTNEQPFVRTFGDGTGSTLFTVDTGLEAPGLGCGQSVQPAAGGFTTPKCWLVAVPVPNQATSPVSPQAWANRVSIPLQFQSVDSPCTFGKSETRLEGSELAQPAIAQWQPTLCAASHFPPYDYSALGDSLARSDLPSATSGGAQMAVVTDPLDPTTLQPGTSAVYAPLTLSALTVAFNIQRVPTLDPKTGEPNTQELPYATTNVATVHLTPRLVAKLLTESYRDELQSFNPSPANNPAAAPGGAYHWAIANPIDLLSDPDFQQFNPEFALLKSSGDPNTAQLAVEFNSADAYSALWQWVIGDREAAEWLAGVPDQWGMQVNPYYSTNGLLNPTGAAFTPSSLANFPKSDPYTEPDPHVEVNGEAVEPLGILAWDPYLSTMASAAQAASTSDVGAKTTGNPNAVSAGAYYIANGTEEVGQRAVLSVTDSASAAKYGLQTAALSQDNQDSPGRAFIPATQSSLLAGVAAMQPSSAASGVLVPNPQTTAAGAYPLTALTYGALVPANMAASDRAAYTNFLAYAAGPGQVPGRGFGFLPPGMVPLPATLAAQTRAAIAAIDAAPLPGATPPTTAPTPQTASTTPSAGSSPSSGGSVAPSASSGGSDQVGVAAPAAPSSAPVASSGGTPAVVGTKPAAGPPVRSVLATAKTPATSVGVTRYAVLVGLAILLASALGAASGMRRPRRAPS